jgi:hypothetical protein
MHEGRKTDTMTDVTNIPYSPRPAALAGSGAARPEARADAPPSSAMRANEPAVDWGRVYREAVAALEPTVGLARMEEVAAEGMYLVFAGEAPERREGETVAGHVARSGLLAWRTAGRAERWHRSPRVSTKVAAALYVPVPTGEAVLSREEERARRFECLVDAIGGDREVADIVRLAREGVTTEMEQAARLGITIEALRNARKRLKRHIDAVNAREDRERAQAQTGEEPPKVRQS